MVGKAKLNNREVAQLCYVVEEFDKQSNTGGLVGLQVGGLAPGYSRVKYFY